jgi:tRNA(Met) C34 N-acetyltransferase TmcA
MHNDKRLGALSQDDWQDLEAFALQRRLPEVAIGALWRLGCMALQDSRALGALEATEKTLLVARVLQKQRWPECAGRIGAAGRAAAVQVLRRAVAKLIRYYAGQSIASRDSHQV